LTDEDFLKLATEKGNKKAAPYNFGAVIVKDGEIISKDHGHVQETNNPSLHAEVSAIILACQKLGSNNIDGAILYASHEPCMMCMSCAAWAHIERVVYSIPAEEQPDFMYEFKGFSIEDFAKKLPRQMKVEQIKL
jgi:tRNA(Arg) A34 adenosine deaminase TadA